MEAIRTITFIASLFFTLLYFEHKASNFISRLCKEQQSPNDYPGAVLFALTVAGWSLLFASYQL